MAFTTLYFKMFKYKNQTTSTVLEKVLILNESN